MADINSTLTPKQQKYLALLQLAEAESLSITHVAKEHNIEPSLLYATRQDKRDTHSNAKYIENLRSKIR